MSSTNRATSKSGKGSKADKSHKSDKSESGKGGGDKQQHRDGNSKSEGQSIKDKVKQLIEMSERPEDEVCLALHECDYDISLAIDMLFDGNATGAWETRVKKKKNRQSSTSGSGKPEKSKPQQSTDQQQETAGDEWHDGIAPPVQSGGGGGEADKERGGRGKGSGRGRGAWRGRERHENEKNAEEGGREYGRRGRQGSGRGGGGGRGGRGGGRAGGRYLPRGNRNNSYNKPIETWDNSNTWDNSTAAAANHTEETWEDDFPGADEWCAEEYQGSFVETKVFTPSVQPSVESAAEPPGSGGSVEQDRLPASQSPVPPVVGALTAAQTQYFTQLQQNNDLNKQYGQQQAPSFQSQSYEKPVSPAQYNAVSASPPYGSASVTSQPYAQPYGAQSFQSSFTEAQQQVVTGQTQQQQQQLTTQHRTKTQRARVPPPSKIPASAVEMPGESNSSVGYLDVQFGALDLIDNNTSFDASMDGKYSTQTNNLDGSTTSATNMDLNASNPNTNLDAYSPKANTQSSISSALSQSLSNTDSIPLTTAASGDHLTSGAVYSAGATGRSAAASAATSQPQVGLEPLGKQTQADGLSYSSSQPSTFGAYQPKASAYSSSTYGAAQTTASSYVSNQANSYVNNQAGGYNPASGNSYPNAYSSNSSYQSSGSSGAFPSISQANTYPSSNQSYPQNTSQSVYGANAGLNSSSSSYVVSGNATSTSQYNNYNSKLSRESSGYESSAGNTTAASQTTPVVSAASAATVTALTLSQSTTGPSKTSTTLAKNSNSIVSNIPPGVAPVMSTPYIMGQVPYFQQPVYSYEDMQLLQQRLPHMTTSYYDMSYQTPTTLAAVRDAAALGGVGYSISDGRFARADNNASPAPPSSTLGQAQGQSAAAQAHQAQPILAAAAAGTGPPYFFATAFNTIGPPNYQFPTMYTQLPAVTNAHGSTNSTAQYPKPATYGSGYGGYDALNQTQEYAAAKGGYTVGGVAAAAAQAQKGTAAANSAGAAAGGNDLTAMYGKSHAALGKVNSYDKQGFHSGTPPPFTATLHGSQGASLAPSGTSYPPVYIPTMAPHQQHHSTHLIQQPLHQMEVRHQGRRMDSGNTSGQRAQASNQAKSGSKQPYQTSYWNQA